MSNLFGSLQAILLLALSVGVVALTAFALVDAIRQRPDAFPATNNQTKPLWLGLLGVAVALSIVSVPGFGLLNMVGIVTAAIYLTKVRPRIREITGGGGGSHGRW